MFEQKRGITLQLWVRFLMKIAFLFVGSLWKATDAHQVNFRRKRWRAAIWILLALIIIIFKSTYLWLPFLLWLTLPITYLMWQLSFISSYPWLFASTKYPDADVSTSCQLSWGSMNTITLVCSSLCCLVVGRHVQPAETCFFSFHMWCLWYHCIIGVRRWLS